MKERDWKGEMVGKCLKVLGISYVVSIVMLLILAFGVFKFGIPEKVVAIGIVLIYIASCFIAGFWMGKITGNKKFLWGLLMGGLYFTVLLIVTALMDKGLSQVASDFGTTLFICLGSGMLGGMLS